MYIRRNIEEHILRSLQENPVTVVVGPRQCGKTTMAKYILQHHVQGIHLDLENHLDLMRLDEAEWYLSLHRDTLICIDEIQRKPELIPLLRRLADEWGTPGCFLILSSDSRDLLKLSSQSLAGVVEFHHLTPLLWNELNSGFGIERYFVQGGFPRSVLAIPEVSYEWREKFTSIYLAQNILQWPGFVPVIMRRVWMMLAHYNGEMLNYEVFANSLDVPVKTVKEYIDLLEDTFMVHVIQPYTSNLHKQMISTPKIYIADSGIMAGLLRLRNFEALMGHPAFGAVWEQMVYVNLCAWFPEASFSFYKSVKGAEIDFVMMINDSVFAVECKVSFTPKLSRQNFCALGDIVPKHTFIVTPGNSSWLIKQGVDVVTLGEIEQKIRSMIS